MSRHHSRGILLGLCLLSYVAIISGTAPIGAASEPNHPLNSWAIIVGVNKFVYAETMKYCGHDARALRRHLIEMCEFPKKNIFIYHSQAEDHAQLPFKSNIDAGRESLFSGELMLSGERKKPLVKSRDTVVFAFSGHGVEIDGEAYLCPTDGHLARPDTLIRLDDVIDQLKESPARHKIVMIDACRNIHHSNLEGSGKSIKGIDVEGASWPEGVAVFSSCSSGQWAFESSPMAHGIFFYYILKGLRGGSPGSVTGQVSLADLGSYVQRQVAGRRDDQTPVSVLPSRTVVEKKYAFPCRPPIENSVGMTLVPIPAGSFVMGSPAGELGRQGDEHQQTVKIEHTFRLSAHEVTRDQYAAVYGKDSNEENGMKLPITSVTWKQARDFCEQLSNLPAEKVAGRRYRLPTEKQWEYACRAGTTTRYHFGDVLLPCQANVKHEGLSETSLKSVGSYFANSLGLYDMHGNAREWCRSDYIVGSDREYVTKSVRGGSYDKPPESARAAARANFLPDIGQPDLGFRVVCISDP